MSREVDADIVVAGGGVGGTFAAAMAKKSNPGLDVKLIERKPEEQAGHIACGDATKSPLTKLPQEPFDMKAIVDNAAVGFDRNIDAIEWRDTADEGVDIVKTLEYQGEGSSVVDRYEFGQELLRQTEELGVDIHYDTVVNDVIQNGRVEGLEAVRDGEELSYSADVTIDAGGALSILADKIDFDATLEDVDFRQMGSAYREIIETSEPVEFENKIIGRPIPGGTFGYIWDFPRTGTETNVGLGFQMTEDPIQMVQVLKEYLEQSDDYKDPEVQELLGKKNKLGSALALRRPRDSMVADGFMVAGGNACTTHPISGKGIKGAAVTGMSAGKYAAEAVENDDVSEEGLWSHNYNVMVGHGIGRNIAARDPFNYVAGEMEGDTLRAVVGLLPDKEIMNIVGEGIDLGFEEKMNLGKGVVENYIHHKQEGTFEALGVTDRDLGAAMYKFVVAKNYANQIGDHYDHFPDNPEEFESWKEERDKIDEFHRAAIQGAPKYSNKQDFDYVEDALQGDYEPAKQKAKDWLSGKVRSKTPGPMFY